MKKFLLALFAVITTTVWAQPRPYAEVVSVQPRYVVIQQQQCREVAVQVPGTSSNAAGGVLGAIAGAAIGNQIGAGSGKDIATAAGAVLGYQAGRGTNQPDRIEYRTVCDMVPVTVQQGETVTFRYRGRVFTQMFE